MAMDSRTWKQFETVNLQDFSGADYWKLTWPCIWRGIGSTVDNLKPCQQAFALKLQQAQAKPNFPGRVVLDINEKDVEALSQTLKNSFVEKLPLGARARAIFGGVAPQFLEGNRLLADLRRPVLFGNSPCFEATTYEKRGIGSLRFQYAGERTIVCAPWSQVLKAYFAASGPNMSEANVQPVEVVKVKSWFRNLTSDPAPT